MNDNSSEQNTLLESSRENITSIDEKYRKEEGQYYRKKVSDLKKPVKDEKNQEKAEQNIEEKQASGKKNVLTFGCRLNSSESDIISYNLVKLGIDDVFVINSCAVTKEAEKQVRQSIRRLKRENPAAKIVVTGCSSQISREKYDSMPEISGIIDNTKKLDISEYMQFVNLDGGLEKISVDKQENKNINFDLNSYKSKESHIFSTLETESALPLKKDKGGENFSQVKKFNHLLQFADADADKKREEGILSESRSWRDSSEEWSYIFKQSGRARGFVQIQNGCNHRCTFCIIPYGRGDSRSLPMADIVAQVRGLVVAGCGEVVLTGVDITDYGSDIPGRPRLGQVMRRLLGLVPEIKRLRLSSIDVAEIDDDILWLLENEPRFMPYLHISLQAGDDMVLKRMKRRHSRQQLIDFCALARSLRPNIAFGADVIAGFPTEDDEMFLNTRALLEKCNILYCHVFPYSERDGTPAARMPQVSPVLRKERARILREESRSRLLAHYRSQIGREVSVVVEGGGIGRAEDFGLVKVSNLDEGDGIGDIIKVLVNDVEFSDKGDFMLGTTVNN